MSKNGENAFAIKFRLIKKNLTRQIEEARKIFSQSNKMITAYTEKVEEIMKKKEEIEKIFNKQKEIETFCKNLEGYAAKIDEARVLIEEGEKILTERTQLIDDKIANIDALIDELKKIPAKIDALEKSIPSTYAEALTNIAIALEELENVQKLAFGKVETTKTEYKQAFDALMVELKEIKEVLLGSKFDELVKTAEEIKGVYAVDRDLLAEIEAKVKELKTIIFEGADLVPHVEVEHQKIKQKGIPLASIAVEQAQKPISAWRTVILAAAIGGATALFITNVHKISKFARSSLSKIQQTATQLSKEIKLPKIEIKFGENKKANEEIKSTGPAQTFQTAPLVISQTKTVNKKIGSTGKKVSKVEAQGQKQPEIALTLFIAELKNVEYGIGIELAQKIEKLIGTERESIALQKIKETKEYLIKSKKWDGTWKEYQINALEHILIESGILE